MRDDDARDRIVEVCCSPLRPICGVVFLCALLVTTAARAADDDVEAGLPGVPRAEPRRTDLPPDRDEFLPVPTVGGNSDTGVKIGAMGSYVRFREGYYPYRFRLDVLVSSSFKVDVRGFRFVQQYHAARLDLPQIAGRMRVDTRADFLRAVDYTWFGVGNATTVEPRPVPPDAASGYDYVAEHARVMTLFRIKTDTPVDVGLLAHTRYEFPDTYPGSKIAEDLASGAVVGGQDALLQTVGAGLLLDTRDSEFSPQRGFFHQLGLAGTVGTAESVRFGEVSLVLNHFVPLSSAVVFASRIIGSFKFGNVPFYELQQGDVFDPQYMVGGNNGLRGVRLGRYAGLVKAIANTELRMSPIPRFRVLRWRLLVGATVFFDAGRVWTDYGFRGSEDGTSLGIKYGTGGGLFFLWDEASLFRIDAAYSPDESGRSFPVSFYFESGFHF